MSNFQSFDDLYNAFMNDPLHIRYAEEKYKHLRIMLNILLAMAELIAQKAEKKYGNLDSDENKKRAKEVTETTFCTEQEIVDYLAIRYFQSAVKYKIIQSKVHNYIPTLEKQNLIKRIDKGWGLTLTGYSYGFVELEQFYSADYPWLN